MKVYDMLVPETNSQSSANTALYYEAASTIMTVLEDVSNNSNSSYEYGETTQPAHLSPVDQNIAIIIGVAISAGLILIFISVFIIYKCYQHYQSNKQAKFLVTSIPSLEDAEQKKIQGKIAITPVNFFYTRVTEVGSNKMTRSTSAPLKPTIPLLHLPRARPRSQPGPVQGVTYSSVDERKLSNILEIPKINIDSHLCASASILDDDVVDLTGITLRQQQTEKPCGRYRPVSAEVDLDQLYAKVNYIKKRKNRMRKDSAAAIAANKSRVNTVTFYHADTDILVENEAEVVYDERTSL